jgi:hypothetical protein
MDERRTAYRMPPDDSTPRAWPLSHREVVAIRPHLVRFSKPNASQKLKFWQGEADVVILARSGMLRVYVAPDPLRLAAELAAGFEVGLIQDPTLGCFELDEKQLQELINRRRLIVQDEVRSHWADGRPAHEAFHFNAGLPHAVVAASDEPTSAIVATIRNDSHLPHCWVFGRRQAPPK